MSSSDSSDSPDSPDSPDPVGSDDDSSHDTGDTPRASRPLRRESYGFPIHADSSSSSSASSKRSRHSRRPPKTSDDTAKNQHSPDKPPQKDDGATSGAASNPGARPLLANSDGLSPSSYSRSPLTNSGSVARADPLSVQALTGHLYPVTESQRPSRDLTGSTNRGGNRTMRRNLRWYSAATCMFLLPVLMFLMLSHPQVRRRVGIPPSPPLQL